MIRAVNRAGRVLAIAVLVLGPPAVAVIAAAHLAPTGAQLRAWADDPGTVLPLLALAAVTAGWLFATVLILRATARRIRHGWQRLRRMPLPTPAQATAGSLAGAALLGLPTLTATTHPAAPPPPTSTGTGTAHSPGAVPAHHEETAGVDLPGGGWLPPHTARDAAAVIGLTWLRRRHTYQPGTPLPSAPVIPVAATVAATYASDGDPGPIPSDRLPPGVTIFTGPGAADAARGLLVTALLAGAHTTPATHIVITAADLHTLLGGGRIPDRLPGLHITDHPDRTARHLTGGPDGTVVQLRYAGPPDQTSSPVVVIAPDAAAAAGRVWTIAADGTHAGDGDTAPGRLCVVPPQTTNDLLTLAAAANRTTTENATAPSTTETASTVPPRPPAASTASARLQVLGACRLVIAGQPVPIRRTAAWQVLVLLAAHPDGATGRQLTEAIWPGLPPATITGRLYTTLAALRGETRNAVGGDDPIIHSCGRYLLNPQVVTCDLWHLHHAIAQASAALSTSQQHTAYRAVIAAHRGELAAGHDWPWLHPLREALTAHVLTAYSTLAAASPPAEAIALLSDAMTVDPYNDAVHRLAFQHLNDAGDHAAATALHDAYARRLATVRLTPTPRWTDDSPTEQRGSSQQR